MKHVIYIILFVCLSVMEVYPMKRSYDVMESTCISESLDVYYKPFTFESTTIENGLLGISFWPLVVTKKSMTENKRFMCTVMGCDKSFVRPSRLIMHTHAVHTGEKPYTCSFEGCDKSYSDVSSLTRHKKIHTIKNSYMCPVCNKAFSDNDNFKEHKRVHIGEKHYACTICKKSFAYQSSVDRHMQTHKESEFDFEY